MIAAFQLRRLGLTNISLEPCTVSRRCSCGKCDFGRGEMSPLVIGANGQILSAPDVYMSISIDRECDPYNIPDGFIATTIAIHLGRRIG